MRRTVWPENVGQVVARAVELGVVPPGAADGLDGPRSEPLSAYGDDPTGALVALLAALGVAVVVDPEVDDLQEGYQDLFGRFSAASGGAVPITAVELVDDGERLRMLVGGEPLDWHVEHLADDYLDTLAVFEIHDELRPSDPADPRRFVAVPDGDGDQSYVFADPAALTALAAELGADLS